MVSDATNSFELMMISGSAILVLATVISLVVIGGALIADAYSTPSKGQ